MKSLSFTIPIRTKSAANLREHHFAKHRRVKAERKATALWFPRAMAQQVSLPAVVYLVRCSARVLDGGDNLPSAMKGVRDQIAAHLGVDDRDPRVDWVYGQKRGVGAVEVKIEHGPDVHVQANCDDPTCRAHWKAA